MADKRVTAVGLGVATSLVLAATCLAALGLLLGADTRSAHGLPGFGALALLPFDGLLLLTLAAYALALVLPHTRLVLGQSIAIALYGLAMILVGLALLAAGLGRFGALVTLLLAFPFGTIAYFVQYACGGEPAALPGRLAAQALGGGCFGGVQAVALAALLLKLAALGALLAASPRFLKVRGLLVLVALATAVAAAMVGLFWVLSDLRFLMYPADAVLTALVGLLIAIHGLVTFVSSLFGVALAIAGQVG